jgi:hypothetical protein
MCPQCVDAMATRDDMAEIDADENTDASEIPLLSHPRYTDADENTDASSRPSVVPDDPGMRASVRVTVADRMRNTLQSRCGIGIRLLVDIDAILQVLVENPD